MSSKPEVLADLRAQFGEHRSTLYASELAQVLGKTTKAIYGLKDRNGLPVPVLPGPGRPCVSIHAVVDWLTGDSVPSSPVKKGPPAPVPAPGRKRQSMGAYLTTLRGQIDFLHEFHAELERIELEDGLLDGSTDERGTL